MKSYIVLEFVQQYLNPLSNSLIAFTNLIQQHSGYPKLPLAPDPFAFIAGSRSTYCWIFILPNYPAISGQIWNYILIIFAFWKTDNTNLKITWYYIEGIFFDHPVIARFLFRYSWMNIPTIENPAMSQQRAAVRILLNGHLIFLQCPKNSAL